MIEGVLREDHDRWHMHKKGISENDRGRWFLLLGFWSGAYREERSVDLGFKGWVDWWSNVVHGIYLQWGSSTEEMSTDTDRHFESSHSMGQIIKSPVWSPCVCIMYVCNVSVCVSVRALTVAILNRFRRNLTQMPGTWNERTLSLGSKSNKGIPYFYPILPPNWHPHNAFSMGDLKCFSDIIYGPIIAVHSSNKPVGDMVHSLTNSIRPLCFHVYIVNHLC